MEMTGGELVGLAAVIGEVDWTDPVMMEWLREQIADAKVREKRFQAAATVQRVLERNNETQRAIKGLMEERRTIATLEELLAQAEASNEQKK